MISNINVRPRIEAYKLKNGQTYFRFRFMRQSDGLCPSGIKIEIDERLINELESESRAFELEQIENKLSKINSCKDLKQLLESTKPDSDFGLHKLKGLLVGYYSADLQKNDSNRGKNRIMSNK